MGFHFVLILSATLLIAGCAQVGTLSGGDKDYFAPVPVEVLPAQKSIRFTGQEVSIRFNEFVELVNPQQNVFFVPNDARPEVRLSNKTLHISWKESLQANTTYSIYLNGVVRDITEGNDSLMTYVFSTGDQIDSLTFNTQVKDAWTNEPVKNALVGLFSAKDTLKPLYFSRSDFEGEVTLSNLKEGEYTVKAYLDEDRDLKMNRAELRGFRESLLNLDASKVDSSAIRLYLPGAGMPTVSSYRFLPPGAFEIEWSGLLPEELSIELNGSPVPSENVRVTKEKCLFFSATDTLSKAQIVLSGALNDTLDLFLSAKEKAVTCQLKPLLSVLGPHDEIAFELNDKIISLDTSLISVMNMEDSTIERGVRFAFSDNRIETFMDQKGAKKLMFTFRKGALTSLNQKEHGIYVIPVELRSEKDYGTLIVTGWDSEVPLLATIKSGNEAPFIVTLTNTQPVKLPRPLAPGEYSVRVIEDLNKNGQWDTGDAGLTVQPERVFDFKPVKIRANWEVELILDPSADE
jgi:uncharacterized protein (DUF2141 family)